MKVAEKQPIKSTSFGQVEDIDLKIDKKNFLHIFNILSSSLYSDKIGAVVRELICNARDANIDSKAVRPIEITAPTSFNPYFVVRDFGYGLSVEGMKTVFASVGESTKQHTNDAVGFFGIGSKSPFAYTDSYVIESIHDGYLSVYNNIKTSTGPKIQRLGTPIKTDKPSGITVKVPVSGSDVSSFTSKIRSFLKFFDQEVIFNGSLNSPEKRSWRVNFQTRKGFKLYTVDAGRYSAGILMGGVVYDVDLRHFGFARSSSSMILEVPVGALTIPPSRENIEYTNNNKKAISEALKEIETTFDDELKNFKFDDAEKAHNLFIKITAFYNSIGINFDSNIKTPFKEEYFSREYTGKKDEYGNNIFENVKKFRDLTFSQYIERTKSIPVRQIFPKRKNGKLTSLNRGSVPYDFTRSDLLNNNAFIVNTESNLDKRLKTFFTENEKVNYITLVGKETLDWMRYLKIPIPNNLRNVSELKINDDAIKRSVVRKKYYYANYGSSYNIALVPVNDQIKDGDIVYVIKCKTKNDAKSSYNSLFSKIKQNGDHLIFCKHRYVDNLKEDFEDNTIVFIDESTKKLEDAINKYKITSISSSNFEKHLNKYERNKMCFFAEILGHTKDGREILKKYAKSYSLYKKFISSFNESELKILRELNNFISHQAIFPINFETIYHINEINQTLQNIMEQKFFISNRVLYNEFVSDKNNRKKIIDFINSQL